MRVAKRWLLRVGLLVGLALALVEPAQAGIPEQQWLTLKDAHFSVHYPAGLERIAERALVVAERARRRLSKDFGHETKRRIHIRVIDETDSANGSANATSYPHINLYSTAPEGMSSLGSYDDWLDVLVTHELAHVVHLDMVSGIPGAANIVLGLGGVGLYWSPQHMLPRWMIEGLATYEESKLSARGRHRYALFDMFLRTAVLEGRRPTIAQLSHSNPHFPYATGPYLYGLQFVHDLATRYGMDAVRAFLHRYGSRVLPFSMNRVAKAAFGKSFDQLWEDFERDLDRRFRAQARAIRARGLRQGRRLTFSNAPAAAGRHVAEPLWSKDDRWIYFFTDDGHEPTSIQKIPRRGSWLREGRGAASEGASVGAVVVARRMSSLSSFDFADSQERRLVVRGRRAFEHRQDWDDLFLLDTKSGRETQLTQGARARDPAVSPDHRSVAFVRNDAGQSRLAFLDLASRKIQELAPVSDSQEVYEPAFDPSGRYVAYSLWRAGGFRNIYIYDRLRKRSRRLTFARGIDAAPVFGPEGKRIYFSSDRSGVFNIYAYDLERQSLSQVSNVLGGAFYPAVSHDGQTLVYVGGSARGYDLWSMELDPSREFPMEAEQGEVYPQADPWPEQVIGQGKRPAHKARRYRAWKTIYPRVIGPQAVSVDTRAGYRALSLAVGANDAAELHNWDLELAFSSLSRVPNFSLRYRTSRFAPNLSLSAGRGVFLQEGFRRPAGSGEDYFKNSFRSRATTGSIGLGGMFQATQVGRVHWSASYRLSKYENLDLGDLTIDPNAPSLASREEGVSARVSGGLSYDDRQNGTFSRNPERGQLISLRLSVANPWLGGQGRAVETSLSVERFFRVPWLNHHVLGLRMAGSMTSRGAAGFGGYSLGGVGGPSDLLASIAQDLPVSLVGTLRGYPVAARSGRYMGLLKAEYRFPLFPIQRGAPSLLLYASSFEGMIFSDWGDAFDRFSERKKLLGSVGAGVRMDLRKGYGFGMQLLFQYARGLDPELGQNSLRLLLGNNF